MRGGRRHLVPHDVDTAVFLLFGLSGHVAQDTHLPEQSNDHMLGHCVNSHSEKGYNRKNIKDLLKPNHKQIQ